MYQQRIADAISNNDPAHIAVVEDMMRTNRASLDNLSAATFVSEARRAEKLLVELALAGLLAEYCEGVGLPVPSMRVG